MLVVQDIFHDLPNFLLRQPSDPIEKICEDSSTMMKILSPVETLWEGRPRINKSAVSSNFSGVVHPSASVSILTTKCGVEASKRSMIGESSNRAWPL